MKPFYFLFTALLLVIFVTPIFAQGPYLPPDKDQESPSTAMVLIENQGQILDYDNNTCNHIEYYMPNAVPSIYAANNKISLVKLELDTLPLDTTLNDTATIDSMTYYQIDLQFISEGDVLTVNPIAVSEVSQYFNYYLSHLPSGGKTEVPAFERIVYEDVWPGIDVHLTTNLIGPKLYFVIAPNAYPSLIDLKFTGQDDINVLTGGALDFILGNTNIQLEELDAYEVDPLDDEITNLTWKPTWKNPNNGERVTIETGTYNTDNYLVLTCSKKTGTLAATLQSAAMDWSTYVGTQGHDQFNDLTHDPNSNNDLITVGRTSANYFGDKTGFQNLGYKGSEDGMITKFKETGELLWVAYYGTQIADDLTDCAVKSTGEIYFYGRAGNSTNLPMLEPSTNGNFNATTFWQHSSILGSVSADGKSLLWATYFEGKVSRMMFDNNNNLYAVGSTEIPSTQTSFPITQRLGFNVYNQPTPHGTGGNVSGDGFILRINSTNDITWLTYFGSKWDDGINDITHDPDNNIYVCGHTLAESASAQNWCKAPSTAGEFPVCNTVGGSTNRAFTPQGLGDGFVAKFMANGELTWSRFYGGSSSDLALTITCNNSTDNTKPHFVSFGGSTLSEDLPKHCDSILTPTNEDFFCDYRLAFKPGVGGKVEEDMFLVKFNDQYDISYSTYLGGEYRDMLLHLTADEENNLYGFGTTSSQESKGKKPYMPYPPPGYYKHYCSSKLSGPTYWISTCDALIGPTYVEYEQGVNPHMGYVFRLNNDTKMPWASFYATNAWSTNGNITLTENGELYLAYFAQSTALPIYDPGNNAYVKFKTGVNDAFISKFSESIGQNLAASMNLIEPEKGEIKLYPNPTSSNSVLESENGNINNLNIYNINGQLIESWKPKSDQIEIKLGGQPSGIYFIQYETKEGVDSKKLIVE